MTIEEIKARMSDNASKLDELVLAYNAAMAKEESVSTIDADIDKIIADYKADAWTVCASELKADPAGPMMAAVRKLSYAVIGVKDTKDSDTGIVTREVTNPDKMIDLVKLNQFCGGIGVEKDWYARIQQFNCVMTVKVAQDLGIKNFESIKNNYYMSALAKQFDLGINPTSNTKTLDALRGVINAMIGEEYVAKCVSRDVKYLQFTYSKKGKNALSVAVANHKKFVESIMTICHRIVTDGVYDVEYKVKKQKK